MNGQMKTCPMHTYQDQDGSTQCKPCAINDVAMISCQNKMQVQYCNPFVPSTQNSPLQNNCISCQACVSLVYYKTLYPDMARYSVEQILGGGTGDIKFCYKPP